MLARRQPVRREVLRVVELAEVALTAVAQDGDDRVPGAERARDAHRPDAVEGGGASEEKSVVK